MFRFLALLAIVPIHAVGQPEPMANDASAYNKPPKHVLDVLHAAAPPQPLVSPTSDSILLVSWVQYPPIAQVAEPFLKLAGVRIEPRTRRRHDTPGGYGIAACAHLLSIVDVASGREKAIALAKDGCADGFAWAADGRHFAFRNTSKDAVELWLGDVAGMTRRLGDFRLNPMLGSSLQWMPDQKTLLVKIVPDQATLSSPSSTTGQGPSIQETDGKSGESSTYETRDTLNSKHDEDLFDYYATSQLALVDIASGRATSIGRPQILESIKAAPDNEHILVTIIKKPYSYVTTYERFANDVQVWNRAGQLVHGVAILPVADRVPIHGVRTGPRDFSWRPTESATLIWAEALDGGDWNVKVPARDRILMQSAPFTGAPIEVARTEQRFDGFEWGEQARTSLLREYDHNRHWIRTYIVNVDDPAQGRKLLWDMSSEESYKDPGQPVHRLLPTGHEVMRQEGSAIFLDGAGASADGLRPFLDRLDLQSGKSERLFRSDKAGIEGFLSFTPAGTKTFMTWRQSPVDPPNAMLRTLGGAVQSAAAGEARFASSTTRAITHIPDPTPQVRGIKKRLITYKRRDGTPLSFTLYTPADYKEGTRVPAILYAYPLDYASASTAGQNTSSDQWFTRLRNYRLLLLSGYAIIDNASFPVVGDPKRAYDKYLEQLVDDARAAVDMAVELGVVDRDRIGVTGHSHGALMTVNLVAHTDLFRAGVATSGSYNKTLTPFGFQSERRSVWKALPVYLKVSPFFVANKIKVPLLIVHGQEDANPGTTPLQAVKLYEAVRGNGGTARLVMLPHEPHWYSAMESNEQLAYEELRWFDMYVKSAAPRGPSKERGR